MRKGEVSFVDAPVAAGIVVVAVLGLALAVPSGAQDGAASISGRIVDASTGQPLARASVTAFNPTATGPAARAVEARTDADGRYVIRALAPGAYHVTASRSGHLQRQYGQAGRSTLGRRVVVRAGAQVTGIDVALLRGGVITGLVTDVAGEPLPGVSVLALAAVPRGRQTHALFQQMQTDDRGRFRMHGLPPGEYLVAANPQHGHGMSHALRQDVPEHGPVLTFAPGATRAADAQRFALADGQEISVDIPLLTGRLVTVAGRVVDASGRPLERTSVRLVPDDADVLETRSYPLLGAGEFRAEGLAPGPYTLLVRAALPLDTRLVPDADVMSEVAVVPLLVPEEGVEGMVVTTSPPTSITGRLVVDGDGDALRGHTLLVVAWSREPGGGLGFVGRGEVDADFSVRVRGLVGQQVLRLSGLPFGWWVKDVRVNGQDVGRGYDFGVDQQLSGLEIVVSNRPVGVRGRVTSSDGGPADAVVIAFPDDLEGSDGLLAAGLGGLTRTDAEGLFTLAGLRPGRYHVVALDAGSVDPATLEDATVLRALGRTAPVVTVTEGAPTILELRPSHVP